jgi:hypothetical protein
VEIRLYLIHFLIRIAKFPSKNFLRVLFSSANLPGKTCELGVRGRYGLKKKREVFVFIRTKIGTSFAF